MYHCSQVMGNIECCSAPKEDDNNPDPRPGCSSGDSDSAHQIKATDVTLQNSWGKQPYSDPTRFGVKGEKHQSGDATRSKRSASPHATAADSNIKRLHTHRPEGTSVVLPKQKKQGKNSQPRMSGTQTNQGVSGNGDQVSQRPPSMAVHHRQQVDRIFRDLVLETLELIRTLVESNAEPPFAMLRLHKMADNLPNGWLSIIRAMKDAIPLDNPLGTAVITLLVDESPLPSPDMLVDMCDELKLTKAGACDKERLTEEHRNICVILGRLAEKMPGQQSKALMSDKVREYLLAHLTGESENIVKLHALIALEKFAATTENRGVINDMLKKNCGPDNIHPLVKLEKTLQNPSAGQKRGVYDEFLFCTQWSLDNVFLAEGRQLSYKGIDNSKIHAMLNSHDVSEYLKLSPDGLQARCDAASFESVRCTFAVGKDASTKDAGGTCNIWYYEVTVITAGVMQIGWATKDSKFLNHEGYGIGDDEYSIAYDGCRQLVWYNAQCEKHNHRCWQPDDVLGLLLDLEQRHAKFYLNGEALGPFTNVFQTTQPDAQFFAAASFMSFQQCEFNFGSKPFRHAPNEYTEKGLPTINEAAVGSLADADKLVLPWSERYKWLHQTQVAENSCTLCYDSMADTKLLPCRHSGLCSECANQLEICPICREEITERQLHRGASKSSLLHHTSGSSSLSSSAKNVNNPMRQSSQESAGSGDVHHGSRAKTPTSPMEHEPNNRLGGGDPPAQSHSASPKDSQGQSKMKENNNHSSDGERGDSSGQSSKSHSLHATSKSDLTSVGSSSIDRGSST